MSTYTKEKDCVEAAKNEYFTTHIPQLILRKKDNMFMWQAS